MGCTESTDTSKAELKALTINSSPTNQRPAKVAEQNRPQHQGQQQHDGQLLPANHVTGLADAAAARTGSPGSGAARRSTPSPPAHEFLTDVEKSIILSDWGRLQQRDLDRQREMGVRIFLRIFELAPGARNAFPGFRDVSDPSTLVNNATFRTHATRFMRVVAGVVDNLDDLDVIVLPNLIQLGKIHLGSAGDLLVREHFDAFERAMTDVWAAELRSRKYSDKRQQQEERVVSSADLNGRYLVISRTSALHC